jgi:RimJ/RimL family protein N-acetyltransferase
MSGENACGCGPAANRFGLGNIRQLSEAEILNVHWSGAPAREVNPHTIVLGYFLGGRLRGVARIMPLRPGPGGRAEITLAVEPMWRGCGIGTMLMAGVLHRAQESDTHNLYLRCHALNKRMQRIAERFGARIGFEDCECFAHIALARTIACQ